MEQAAARAEKLHTEEPESDSRPEVSKTSAEEPKPPAEVAPKKITLKLNRHKGEKRAATETPPRPPLKIKRQRSDAEQAPRQDEVSAEKADPQMAKSASEDPVLPGEYETPLNVKKVRSVLQVITKTPEASIFLSLIHI